MLFGQTFCLPVTSISSAASKDQPEEAKSPHQVAAGVPKPGEFSLIDPSVLFNFTKLSDVMGYMLDMSRNLGIRNYDMKTFAALYQFHCSVRCCKGRRWRQRRGEGRIAISRGWQQGECWSCDLWCCGGRSHRAVPKCSTGSDDSTGRTPRRTVRCRCSSTSPLRQFPVFHWHNEVH